MALFFEKKQDEQVFHLSRQLAEAVQVILNANSSRDKRIEATRVSCGDDAIILATFLMNVSVFGLSADVLFTT